MLLKFLKQIDSPGKILPVFLTLITGVPRYLPDIEWSSKSWVHNIFRVYEKICWRRAGIRPEITSYYDNGEIFSEAYSFEGSCVLLEEAIRQAFKFKLVKLYLPVFAFAGFNVPYRGQPYLFAIAFDATSSGSGGSSFYSFNHTTSGSNRLLVEGVGTTNNQGNGVTYNGTTFDSVIAPFGGSPFVKLFYLVNPAVGTNSVNVTSNSTGSSCRVCSYTGVKQTGQPDSSTPSGASGTSNSPSVSITTVTAGCLIIMQVAQNNINACSGTGGSTSRGSVTDGGANFTLIELIAGAAGSTSISATTSGSPFWQVAAYGFASNAPTPYTLAMGTGTFALTGQNAAFIYGRKIALAVGSYVLTGYNLLFTIAGWMTKNRNDSSYGNTTRHDSSFSNASKHDDIWSNKNKL